jgi:hypothetical protein
VLTLDTIEQIGSALAKHSQDTGHHICIEDTKIIAKLEHYGKRKIWEALEIKLNGNNINRDKGLKISEKYQLIEKMKFMEKLINFV